MLSDSTDLFEQEYVWRQSVETLVIFYLFGIFLHLLVGVRLDLFWGGTMSHGVMVLNIYKDRFGGTAWSWVPIFGSRTLLSSFWPTILSFPFLVVRLLQVEKFHFSSKALTMYAFLFPNYFNSFSLLEFFLYAFANVTFHNTFLGRVRTKSTLRCLKHVTSATQNADNQRTFQSKQSTVIRSMSHEYYYDVYGRLRLMNSKAQPRQCRLACPWTSQKSICQIVC